MTRARTGRADARTARTVADAALGFFAGATDLVGIVESQPPHRVLYLNATAERFVDAPGPPVLGRPLAETFSRAAGGPIRAITAQAAAGGQPQRLRGVTTRPASTWNLDAIPAGDAILLVGRPLDTRAVSRHRLEMLLASTETMWLNADTRSLAQAVVDSAAKLIPGIACSLSILPTPDADALEIVAGSEDWLCVGTVVPLAGSHSGKALETRRPVEAPAGRADESHRSVLADAGVELMRVVPLLPSEPLPDGRTVLGVLSFMRRTPTPFDVDERRLLDEFGKRASVALDRAEHVERERERAERMHLAFDTALALSSSLSPRAVIDELLQRVVTIVNADRATLSTIADERITIEATYSRRGSLATWIGRSYALDYIDRQPVVREAINSRKPVTAGRLDAGSAAPEFRDSLNEAKHTATVPLISEETVAGLLVVSRDSDAAFSADDLATLNLIGHAAMLALNNARLHAEAIAARTDAERLAQSLQIGVDTALDLGQELGLEDVVEGLLRRSMQVAGADRCVLLSIDGGDAVVIQSTKRDGDEPAVPAGARLQIAGQPLVEAAVRTGATQQGPNVEVENLGTRYRREIKRLRYFASVPLRYGGVTTGVLNLSRYVAEPFTDQQLQALTLLGQVAALAMHNARLFEDLRMAAAAKTDFLNLAAHELRTPISVLRGYLSMMLDGSLGPMPDTWERPLQILIEKATGLNEITEELLAAARLHSGAVGWHPRPFDLVAVVREAITAAGPSAELAGGRIDVAQAPRSLRVVADPTQVRHVIDNLLANAVLYSDEAPAVTVVVERDRQAARVTVRDRGRGIPADKHESVFEQFVRVVDPTAEIRPGTGLGLYVARGLARANGGDVRLVSSQVGKGSEFVFEVAIAGR